MPEGMAAKVHQQHLGHQRLMHAAMTSRPFVFPVLAACCGAAGLLQSTPLMAQAKPTALAQATRVAQVKADPLPHMPVVKIADSRPMGLSLAQVLDAVAATYPILVAARTEAKAAAQDVQATERLRWPSVWASC